MDIRYFIRVFVVPFCLAGIYFWPSVRGQSCGALTIAEPGDDLNSMIGKAMANFRRACKKDEHIPATKVPAAVCLPLPTPANGVVNCTSNKWKGKYHASIACTVTCTEGYAVNGSASRSCLADGSWDGTEAECIVTGCLPLPAPAYGAVNCTNKIWNGKYPTNTSCSPNCQEGYAVNGSANRSCLADGSWDGTEAECKVILCAPLPAPAYGVVNCTTNKWNGEYLFKTECTVTCPEGYALNGSASRSCLVDGSWDGTEAECVEILCDVPVPDDNGNWTDCLQGRQVTNGTSCILSCATGYRPVSTNRTTCISDEHGHGVWSKDVQCTDIVCNVPTLDNGQWSNCSSGLQVTYGSSCIFTCATGYRPERVNHTTCISDGRDHGLWSDDAQCVEIQCYVPFPASGYWLDCLLGRDVLFGITCTLLCFPGYRPAPVNQTTCVGDENGYGVWVEPIQCEAITCDVPSLESGQWSGCLSGAQVTVGTTCILTCPTTHQAIPANHISCMSQGSQAAWSQEIHCEEVGCAISDLPSSPVVNNANNCSHGLVPVNYAVTVECNADGNSDLQTCVLVGDNPTWSSSYMSGCSAGYGSARVYKHIGVQHESVIPHEHMRASSDRDAKYAWKGRLNDPVGWCSDTSDSTPWIEADLGASTEVSGVILALCDTAELGSSVRSFKFAYKMHPEEVFTYVISIAGFHALDPEVFQGDVEGPIATVFSNSISATHVRIYPYHWSGKGDFPACLTFELLGCQIN